MNTDMGERIFKLNTDKSMPGHTGGDLLKINENLNYQWLNAPVYEMAPNQIEGHPDFFTEYVPKQEPITQLIGKQELNLLRALLIHGNIEKANLFLEEMIQQIEKIENGTNETNNP